MKSEETGAQKHIKDRHAGALYTHCRSHCLNLSIVHACELTEVKNMMDTITSASGFFVYN